MQGGSIIVIDSGAFPPYPSDRAHRNVGRISKGAMRKCFSVSQELSAASHDVQENHMEQIAVNDRESSQLH